MPIPIAISSSVYPRVGGGTHVIEIGEHGRDGLSPRRRGNLGATPVGIGVGGSIPA